MQEVTATICFNTACLGAVRDAKCNQMLRDPSGRVMLLPTWWLAIMKFAAEVKSKHQENVRRIEWDPVVSGSTQVFKRFYNGSKYVLHEAFLKGDLVRVNCVLPDGMSLDEFKELLGVAGAYKGMSPYRSDQKFGTFEVVKVEPRKDKQEDQPKTEPLVG